MAKIDRIDEGSLEILERASQIAADSKKENLQKHLNQFRRELEEDKAEDISLASDAYSKYSEYLEQKGHNVATWDKLDSFDQNGWETAIRWVRHKLMTDMAERSIINDEHSARSFAYSYEGAMAIDREGSYLVVIEGGWHYISLDDEEIWELESNDMIHLPLKVISEGH